jgi:hypothetical protein
MVCLFDRFLTEELSVPSDAILSFYAHPRIQVQVYDDSPCYTALFYVDGKPTLKENLIDGLSKFFERTIIDANFHAFLIEIVS